MMDGAIGLVREYLSGGDAAKLEVISESAVGPIRRLIEESCDIIDEESYRAGGDHVRSIVSQRMEQSRLARRSGEMGDDELLQAFQEMCAEVTREVSFALLRRDVIRPKADAGDRLADELRIKSLLVSCEYSKLGWMWVERVMAPEMRLRIPKSHYHAVRHELYYICVAEAVKLHRAIELGNFSYRDVQRATDKIREMSMEFIAEGRIPKFKAKAMGRSRPLFQRFRPRSRMEGGDV
jgi:hypothetical protein